MKKTTLASRVLAHLKGGDEAKMARFEGKLEKYFEKQVKAKQDKISTLQDKIVDATEDLNECVLNVDLEQINKTESAESYSETYVRNVKYKLDVVEGYEEEIKQLEADMETLKKIQETIYSVEETN